MQKTCRVLSVEDSPHIQQLLELSLVGAGYCFAVALDAIEMRQALAQRDVDLVMIDVVLPGGETGIALAEEVARQGYGVVLVTGHPAHFETVAKSGHHFLHKPFRIAELLQVVDDALRERGVPCDVKGKPADSTDI